MQSKKNVIVNSKITIDKLNKDVKYLLTIILGI